MQVVRNLLIAVIAGIVAVSSVACSIDGVPVAAKVSEAPLTKLMPLTANDGIVVGKDRHLSCGEGTTAVQIAARLGTPHLGTHEVVDHTNRVWVDKKNPNSSQPDSSEAIYSFNGALPKVRGVIVTFRTTTIIIPGEWHHPSDISFRATWPKEAATGPVRISVKSLDFTGEVRTIKSATLCMEL